jgi:NADH-quinone oxidoreductase subunit E
MLSQQEKEKIEEDVRMHEHPRAAVSEALLIVQESRGWVPDDAITDIAALLGMGRAEVEGIATYYELIFRKPVGRHVIMLCDSVSCWVTGEKKILAHLQERLGIGVGETTADASFTLLPAGCLGACDKGPAMTIDGKLYDSLTPERADQILAQYGMGPNAKAPHG